MDYEKKIQVTESETEEGVRNIRIKFDQRQTGHDQNSLFAGGNQKGRKEKGKITIRRGISRMGPPSASTRYDRL